MGEMLTAMILAVAVFSMAPPGVSLVLGGMLLSIKVPVHHLDARRGHLAIRPHTDRRP